MRIGILTAGTIQPIYVKICTGDMLDRAATDYLWFVSNAKETYI